MTGTMHRSEFVRQLKAAVPESVAALRGYRDNLTMEMLALTILAQDAMTSEDLDLVRRCFSFANEVLEKGTHEVRNALIVGFLEDLDFTGPAGRRAELLLTPALRNERQLIRAYIDGLRTKGAR